MTTHAVVWLDHEEARIFHFHPETPVGATVHAPERHIHKHPKGASEPKEHPGDETRFFHDVAQALEGTEGILVVGPSTTKLAFFKYVQNHDKPLEPRILGIETVDHPTDRQLVAFAKKYFALSDRAQAPHGSRASSV